MSSQAQGIVVEETDRIPTTKKYVEFRCGFKDRQGNPACDWTSNLMSRTAANQLLGEHWTIYHETEFKQIQKEKELERERDLAKELKKIKEQEQKDEIERENAYLK